MEKIKLINNDGVEEEYDIMLSYIDSETHKGYLVYTDGVKKYLASFNPDDENDLDLKDVDDPQEIDKVRKLMVMKGEIENG